MTTALAAITSPKVTELDESTVCDIFEKLPVLCSLLEGCDSYESFEQSCQIAGVPDNQYRACELRCCWPDDDDEAKEFFEFSAKLVAEEKANALQHARRWRANMWEVYGPYRSLLTPQAEKDAILKRAEVAENTAHRGWREATRATGAWGTSIAERMEILDELRPRWRSEFWYRWRASKGSD